MFDTEDVIGLMREARIVFVKQTVFAPETGAAGDLGPELTPQTHCAAPESAEPWPWPF